MLLKNYLCYTYYTLGRGRGWTVLDTQRSHLAQTKIAHHYSWQTLLSGEAVPCPAVSMNEAKRRLAPHQPQNAWAEPDGSFAFHAVASGPRIVSLLSRPCGAGDDSVSAGLAPPPPPPPPPAVAANDEASASGDFACGTGWAVARIFEDKTARLPISSVASAWGDDLPEEPCVLTGVCDAWPAFADDTAAVVAGFSGGSGGSVSDGGDTAADSSTTRSGGGSRRWSSVGCLARLAPVDLAASVDGGPAFARQSYGEGRVSLSEYARYCADDADGDAVPMYVFDHRCLSSSPATGLAQDFSVPECLSKDAMSCLTDTRFRPLPPAWLLVGCGGRSGTPIHDHPNTAAWNAVRVYHCCEPRDAAASTQHPLSNSS